MLVLTRKTDESIVIGDDIVIKVVEVSGKAVKIGIDAPKEVTVYRHEVYEAIKEENMQALEQENVVSLVEFMKLQNKDK